MAIDERCAVDQAERGDAKTWMMGWSTAAGQHTSHPFSRPLPPGYELGIQAGEEALAVAKGQARAHENHFNNGCVLPPGTGRPPECHNQHIPWLRDWLGPRDDGYGGGPGPGGACIELRPCVLAFAVAMERKLREHDEERGERGWKDGNPFAFIDRIREETQELEDAATEHSNAARVLHQTRRRMAVLDEAADVANMAMMVADSAGAL